MQNTLNRGSLWGCFIFDRGARFLPDWHIFDTFHLLQVKRGLERHCYESPLLKKKKRNCGLGFHITYPQKPSSQ